MAEPNVDPDGTVLTERQFEVLALRRDGLTQAEIADQFGTSVANVSSIESSARRNVARAHRTVEAVRWMRAIVRFHVSAGTHLRDVVERVYEAGDDAGVKVVYGDPELSTYLHVRLGDRLHDRRLTNDVEVGLTADGDIVLPGQSSTDDLAEFG